MRKPIFSNPTPTLTNFEAKLELLRKMGIDASSAESWNSYYNKSQILSAAHSGAMNEVRLGKVYDIIYNKTNEELTRRDPSIESKDAEPRLGSEIFEPEYNLLRYSKEIADIRRVSEALHNSEPENIVVLENLTKSRARELVEMLEKVEINKEGETLNENNFDNFNLDLKNTMIQNAEILLLRLY